LQKNPDKRMTIKETIEHPWLENKIFEKTLSQPKNKHLSFEVYSKIEQPDDKPK
jgi:hypothetical protein